MPREPKPAKHPNQKYNLVILVSGEIKNLILQAAAHEGVSLQQYCNTIIVNAARQQLGLPQLTDGTPLPTPAQTIHHYITGEPLLKPCGKTNCTPVPINLDKQTYCDTCGCRMQ